MRKHEHYEELCALAAGGQLTEQEAHDLMQHTASCGECRSAREEFSALLQELPPLDDTIDLLAVRQAEEEGYRNRFLARGRAEGRRFSPDAERGPLPARTRWGGPRLSVVVSAVPQWAMGAAVALLAVGGFAYVGQRYAAKWSLLRTQGAVGPPVVATRSDGMLDEKVAKLQDAMASAEKRIETLAAENASLRSRLEVADKNFETRHAEKGRTADALAQANQAKAQLEEQLRQNGLLLTDARSELDQLRAQHSATLANLAVERRSVDDLSARLKSQGESLDREKELLTAGRDVTDLMGARNLHVVDVYDGDEVGKNKTSFGRIFYTERKSLIFYAFDLDEKKLVNAKYSYKAWGERQANPTSVKSLGIFYVDDKAQRRWALKVDNPQELAEIDSVFVTLEPREGGDKPHGPKLLFAFLGSSANHP